MGVHGLIRRIEPLPAIEGRAYFASHFDAPEGRSHNGRPLCCWCHGEVPAPRRRWCGDDCVAEFNRIAGSNLSFFIFDRDEGRCQLCWWDLGRLERVIDHAHWHYRDLRAPGRWELIEGWLLELLCGYPAARIWQCDHRRPLSEGGLTHPDNLRTLCVPCHKIVTAQGVRRRAESKQGAING